MISSSKDVEAADRQSGSKSWYRWYVVVLLSAVYIVSVMDRNLLAILQEPLKKDLNLSDSQLGLLSGMAFAFFYSTMAIPIARLADRANRVALIAAALAMWSLMTAGCGLASNVVLLFLFRMGVGVGEAGGYPPSGSVVADYFSRNERGTAMSILGVGATLGASAGLIVGGILEQGVGWRMAFVIAGGVGLALAPLVWFTIREPIRGMSDSAHVVRTNPVGLRSVISFLWNLKSIRYILLGNCLTGVAVYSFYAWAPSFYIRIHGLRTVEIASILGITSAIASPIGVLVGGRIADRVGRTDTRWFALIPALAAALLMPVLLLQVLVPNAQLSLAISACTFFLMALLVGPILAITQSLVVPEVRATTGAVSLMTYNIIGLGCGPLLTGALSDLISDAGGGAHSVRYALALVSVFFAFAASLLWRAARSIPGDIERDRTLDFPAQPAMTLDSAQRP